MNKPSERIVVFVTPAQKRAISATADGLGISISELMRRAVLAFSATSDQVRAASIVDRLNAPREPDALAQVLRRAAKPLRTGRAAPLRHAAAPAGETDAQTHAEAHEETAEPAYAHDEAAAGDATQLLAANGSTAQTAGNPGESASATLPEAHAAAAHLGNAAREIGRAVARLSAEADTEAEEADAPRFDPANLDDEPLQSLGGSAAFARTTHPHGDADARHDGHNGGAPEDGKFA
jgi:hypothetical protein